MTPQEPKTKPCPWCPGEHVVSPGRVFVTKYGNQWGVSRYRCSYKDITVYFAARLVPCPTS